MLKGLHKNPLVSSRARRECTNYWFHTAICCTNPRCSVICLLFTGEHDYRVFSKLRNPCYLFDDDFVFCGHWTVWRNGKAPDVTFRTEKFRGFPQNFWVNTGMLPQHRPRSLPTRSLSTHHSWLHSHLIRLSVIKYRQWSSVCWYTFLEIKTERRSSTNIAYAYVAIFPLWF